MYIKWMMGIIIVVSLFNSGCGVVAERDTILKDARTAYSQAQTNPNTEKLAAVALYEAKQALQRAENASSAVEMQHLAYLAQRQSQIATAIAERKVADMERETLGKQQKDVVIEARGKEAEKARAEAEAKAWEAEVAKGKAEAKAREAEIARERLAAEKMKSEDLQKQLTEALQGKQTDKGLVLTLGDILFETAKADLLPGSMSTLDKIAIFLNQNPKRNVLVEGHTDSRGSDDYNMGLSQRRADAVRFALMQRNVSSSRILSRGFGKARPIASNTDEGGRQKNRRVEITILNEGEILR